MPKSWFVLYSHRRLRKVRPRRWLPKGFGSFEVLTRDWKFGMCFSPFWGICCVARTPKHLSGVGWATAPTVVWKDAPVKKKSMKTIGDAVHLAPLETQRFDQLLPLVEHCAVRRYEDGDSREPGWFTVKTSGAAWVVQVKDPDSACSFAAVGETLDKALETAALLLGCDEAPWEADRFLAQQKATKKK